MPVKVVMPPFEETMQSGRIVKWLKREGETVSKGLPIVEVETQKVNAEIEAPESGILVKILVEEGDEASVLQTIGIIASPGESLDVALLADERIEERTQGSQRGNKEADSESVETSARIPVAPIARKLAREYRIDLKGVQGSGPGGRITREDILRQIQAISPLQGTSEQVELVPISKIRRTIAERMSYSAKTAPQVTVTSEVNMSEVVKLRTKLLIDLESSIGIRISYTDILIKALARVLTEQPIFNSRFDDDYIKLIKEINLGVAIQLEEGVIVPVVRDANKKTLAEIAKCTSRLIEDAREGKLSSSDLSGGTFTISNLGMYDVDVFTPLINTPETAILGVGRIMDKPVVSNGEIEIRPMMYLSLSFDHRAIDGAQAARFIQRLAQILHDPSSTLVDGATR